MEFPSKYKNSASVAHAQAQEAIARKEQAGVFDATVPNGQHMVADVAEIELQVMMLFDWEEHDSEQDELLANSLFYHSAGSDPTPVFAFGASIPLYVFVDLLVSGVTFKEATCKLYARLADRFTRLETIPITKRASCEQAACGIAAYAAKDAELTRWQDADGKVFHLVYLQQDAETAFRALYYNDDSKKYTLPACLCNIKAESGGYPNQILQTVAKRVQTIFGNCYSDKYKVVASVPYYGDYSQDHPLTIHLWERRYYYLF